VDRILHIWVNCPSTEVAEAITDALLEQKLIASANRYPPVQSAYVWDGSVQRSEEHPLLVKTKAELGDLAEAEVRRLHPCEVPAIICLAVDHANADYIAWVHAETRAP
jgi:periplasmic divalent cation tolerance protein